MSKNEAYDVIIIGASPAGLASALTLAKHVKTLLIDRKKVGVEHHPADTFFHSMFQKTGLRVSDSYVINKVDGMKIISPSGNYVFIDSLGYSIDRRLFDSYYLEKITELGAEYKRACVLKAEKTSSGVRVLASSGGKRFSYHTKLLIGADGIESYVAKWFGLKSMKYPLEIASAVQAEMKNVDIDSTCFHYFIGSVAPGWKASISPKGASRASVAVFVRGTKKPAIEYFRVFLKKYKRIFAKAEITKLQAGGDPIAAIPNQLVCNNVMVAGGAAGQAGIAYGIMAGILCGKVAREAVEKRNMSEEFLRTYERKWRKLLLGEYKIAHFTLRALSALNDKDVELLIRIMRDINVNYILRRAQATLLRALYASLISLIKAPYAVKLALKIAPESLIRTQINAQ